MKRMKMTALQQVFRAFERMNRVWENEGGAEGGAGGGGESSGSSEGGEGGDGGSSEGGDVSHETNGADSQGSESGLSSSSSDDSVDLASYMGDKKLNPEQRPLKKFNRNGMSKQDIDKLLREAGSELFMTEDEIADRKSVV